MSKKIAFDLHGVLDKHQEIFKPMIRMLRLCGNKVCVVSGPPADSIQKELKDLKYTKGLEEAKVYSVVDFLNDSGVKFSYDENGNPWCDEETWWDAKARICKHYKIDIMVDDSLKYKPAFDLVDCIFVNVDKILKGWWSEYYEE
jgi:hypothetical protein